MTRRSAGFTLIELIITISISAILGLVVYQFASGGWRAFRVSAARSEAQDSVRQSTEKMVEVLREARAGDNGAYPIAQADNNRLIVYTNIDTDASVERVEFALNGTTLEQRVVNATGSPAQYTQAPTVTPIGRNVRSLLFEYFTASYTGTQNPLVQPVTVAAVRVVRLTVSVDDNVATQPPAVALTTIVSLRNLKDNL